MTSTPVSPGRPADRVQDDLSGAEIVLLPCSDTMRQEQLRRLADRGTGFLDCDPLHQPIEQMVDRLESSAAILFAAAYLTRADDELGLVGFVPNPRQGDQWTIDVLPAIDLRDAPRLVHCAVAFARTYLAARSLLRFQQVRDTRDELFRSAGFTEIGRLREALYENGRYWDQQLLWRTAARLKGEPE